MTTLDAKPETQFKDSVTAHERAARQTLTKLMFRAALAKLPQTGNLRSTHARHTTIRGAPPT